MGKKTDATPIGEGNYEADRRFRKGQEEFAKHGPVKEKAREAADALAGPQGKELERARKKSARGET